MAKRMCGPGPGAYRLPTTVGYAGHDPSRYRNPMFSFGGIYISGLRSLGPGPVYKIDQMTCAGRYSAPAWTFGGKYTARQGARAPGPGAHAPERCPVMATNRSPMYSFGKRLGRTLGKGSPAPNAYMIRSGAGGPAWTMAARLGGWLGGSRTPGPAAYLLRDLNVYRQRMPVYTLGPRLRSRDTDRSPGPACYGNLFNTKKTPYAFSFGTKHADWAPPLIIDEDEMPCLPR